MTKKWNEWAPLPVRLVIGGGLTYHGYPKLFTADGHASFLHIMQGMHVPFPELASWLVAILEFGGGLCLLFGAFVVTVGLLIALEMVINLVTTFLQGGPPPPLNPNQPLPSNEQSFLYLAGALALWIGGAGTWSVDSMLRRKTDRMS
jgi:putative oxidoreductase